jgi:hypothetical protein
MGKSERRKGHQWERAVAISLRDIDPTAKRLLEYQEGAGHDLATVLPYRFQCRNRKNINWVSSLKEIPESDGNVPVVAGKVTNKGEYAFLKWSDFIWLLKRAHLKV